MTRLLALTVADDPEVWSGLGFTVERGSVRIGTTAVMFAATTQSDPRGRGILGWTLSTIDGSAPDRVDGLPTNFADPRGVAANRPFLTPSHPNGVVGIDHLVVMTPDVNRTVATLEGLGLLCRRLRETARDGSVPMRQAFFWLGEPNGASDGRVILEVVGPETVDPTKADEPARFFGLALTCTDLDSTAAFFGDVIKPPVAAVQPGRRIATLSSRAGSTVAIAFMSPHT